MIIFQNPGLIDLMAVETFGANVKPSKNSIGQFGTGLKYAIAVIMREGGRLDIFRGGEHYTYSVKQETIRDKEFGMVYQNDHRMAFTTEFGKNWQPWQAFRELWSNCKDEGGSVRHIDESDHDQWHPDGREISRQIYIAENETVIVWAGEAAEKAWSERETVLLSTDPISELDGVSIHPGESDYIYYQGIRVYKLPKASKFTYNLKSYHILTEERMLAYWHAVPGELAKAICQCANVGIIETVLTSAESALEGIIDWSSAAGMTPSDQFVQTSLKLRAEGRLGGNAKTLFKSFSEHYISRGYVDPEVVELSTVESAISKDAIAHVRRLGFNVEGVSFNFKSGMDEDDLFAYHSYGDTISINYDTIQNGVFAIAQAIVCGLAWRAGGRPEEQLAYFIINGEFDEKKPRYNKKSDEEMIF